MSRMKTPLLLRTALVVLFTLYGCTNLSNRTTPEIEGLWVTTEETSSLFAPGADRVALMLTRDRAGVLSARGMFLKNKEYKMDWEYKQVQYDPDEKRLTILDADLDTIICSLGAEKEMLTGAIHLLDHTQEPLVFIRAGQDLENRLFYPRLPGKDGKISYSYEVPEQVDDGLETESLYSYTSDSSSFTRLMNEVIDQEYGRIKSLLILKDNKLLVEEYFYAYERDDLHQIRSCTKSITSLLLGIALDRHPEVDMEQGIFRFFPDYAHLASGGREDITLRNVLTMHAGLEWDDYPGELYTCEDGFEYILSRPMALKAGESFHYNSGCSVLLGGVVEFLESKSALEYAREFLFAPLGIRDFVWESHQQDILQCGHGLSLRPRDMAKAGLLVVNDGKWQEKQIVSDAWIRESTSPQVEESAYYDYGYHWWHRSDNKLQWWKEPNAASPGEHELINAMGHGGQYIIIIKDLNLVIVTTASDFEDGRTAQSKIPMALEKIAPLFEND